MTSTGGVLTPQLLLLSVCLPLSLLLSSYSPPIDSTTLVRPFLLLSSPTNAVRTASDFSSAKALPRSLQVPLLFRSPLHPLLLRRHVRC